MQKVFLLLVIIFIVKNIDAQNVGIGTSTPNASAILDINSTTKGTLITRMTTAQRKAISTPSPGLLVFDLDKKTIYMWDGIRWLPFLFASTETKLPLIPLSASDGVANDRLGTSISISGNYAIVSASYANVGANIKQGCAYIFYKNNYVWQQQAKLIASDGAANDFFGTSVGISGDYAIIGSPYNTVGFNPNQGSAYIFFRSGTTWVQQAKIIAADGTPNCRFGTSVSISGDNAVVGAPYSTVGFNPNQGAAYIFSRSGSVWPQQQKLTASDGAPNDQFGNNVSISGLYVAVGADDDDIGANTDQGSVWIYGPFLGINWTTLAKLTASDGASFDYFGSAISISGDYIIIGAWGANALHGAAYIFMSVFGIWSSGQAYQAKLNSANAANETGFGFSVSMSGDIAIVGMTGNQSQQLPASVYVFKRSGTNWSVARKVEEEAGLPSDLFGLRLGIDGYNIIISASGRNNNQGEISFLNIE
jgi:hypothetical protein